jgi:formate dehydrogenase subunit delta
VSATSRQIDHLVKMANQIALNLAAWGDEETVAQKTAEHIEKFWTPAMRRELLAYQRAGGAELAPAVRRALAVGQPLEQSTIRSTQ